jgi:2-methylisocitrate lyase-like PEP mutase family enzyme
MSHANNFRLLLGEPGVIKAPGVYDGLTARLVDQAGFSAAFLSGAGIAFARFGRPDMGLVTASEMVDSIAIIRDCTQLPLIVDMDTGYGNALNVQRTVRTFERAGASALLMEDQLMPKRCGHMAGKQVISCAEMEGKIKAALDSRQNQNTAIIARTDALGVNGFDDAIERAHRYLGAGADALFIEAPKNIEQMRVIGATFGAKVALIHNLVEGGGSPVADSSELVALNYKVALYPVALLHAFIPQAEQLLQHIFNVGNTADWQGAMVNLSYMNDLLGAPELMAKSKLYGFDDSEIN